MLYADCGFFCRADPKGVERITGVSNATVRRWGRGGTIPEPARRLILLTKMRDLGAIDPAWAGWSIHDGRLYESDTLESYSPGQVASLFYLQQKITPERLRAPQQLDLLAGVNAGRSTTDPTDDPHHAEAPEALTA